MIRNFIKRIVILGFLSTVAPLFIFAPTVAAQQEQTVAILDLGKVLVSSLAMKDVDRQLKVFDKKLKDDAKAREASFRSEQDALAQQRVIISPEQYDAKSKALSAKGREYRLDFQTKVKQLAQSRSLAINKIEAAMEPIVSAVAKSVGATMIVEKKRILFGEKKLEISTLVTDRLNAKLKKMKVVLVPLKPVK
ncbi:MAG: OmpH family outer membrane protein [Sneathiella sp.]